MRLLLVAGCALSVAGTSPSECTLADASTVPLGWKGTGTGTDWCSTCYCVGNGVANAVKKCRTACGPADAALRCCPVTAAAETTTTHSCCGLNGQWTLATVGADTSCKHVTRPHAVGLAAPFAANCALTCTVAGLAAQVPVGWEGYENGANWCNKCICTAGGALNCRTTTCPPAKCCDPTTMPVAGAPECCGATGEWVIAPHNCAGHLLTAPVALPYAAACNQCDVPGTPPTKVPAGWFGKIRCNNCHCGTAGGALTCATKKCDCDFSSFNADATGVTRRYVQTGFVAWYKEAVADPQTCLTKTCTGPGIVAEATGVATTAGCPFCSFTAFGADEYAITHAAVAAGFKATYTDPLNLGMCKTQTCVIAAPLTGTTTVVETTDIECPKTCDFTAHGNDVSLPLPGRTYGRVDVGFSAVYTGGVPCKRRQCASHNTLTETDVPCP